MVRPNLVVGVFGAVVFLVTGSIIVQDWRGLTDTRDYAVTVVPHTAPEVRRSSSVASGSSSTQVIDVPYANVTRATARLTWEDHSLTGGQHDVTLTLRDPQGVAVGEGTGRGDDAGITLDAEISPAPAGGRFTTRSSSAAQEFEARYPQRGDTVGPWSAVIATNRPTQPGTTGITYSLTFQVTYYNATYQPAAPLTR